MVELLLLASDVQEFSHGRLWHEEMADLPLGY